MWNLLSKGKIGSHSMMLSDCCHGSSFCSALIQFFLLFSDYKENDFYATGEVSWSHVFVRASSIIRTEMYGDTCGLLAQDIHHTHTNINLAHINKSPLSSKMSSVTFFFFLNSGPNKDSYVIMGCHVSVPCLFCCCSHLWWWFSRV